MQDPYKEILIVIIACIFIFLVLTGIIVFAIIFNQKRKFIHDNQIILMQKQYNEQLLQAQLEIQEQTLNFVNQEIHDNVGQLLSLAKLQISLLEQQGDFNKLADVKNNISKAMNDLRDIARSLSSESIQKTSLPETVNNELQRINRADFLRASFHLEGAERNLSEHKKLIIFRIIQESLQNIIRHSHATLLTVNFCYAAENLRIDIADNGSGFELTSLDKDKNAGLGLENMVRRASLIGGAASFTSKLNKGTTITIITPYG